MYSQKDSKFRIGIDLDDPSDLELVTTSINAESVADEVKYFISCGRRGVHLELTKIHCYPMNIDSKNTLRLNLGDDTRRIMWDTERIYNDLEFMYDTLWSEKRRHGKVIRRIECADLENCLSMLRMYRRVTK